MNKKSGTAGQLTAPNLPLTAKEAAVADPGFVTTASAQSRTVAPGWNESSQLAKGGASGGSSASSSEPRRKVWISIELRDDAGKPVADQPYEIKVPGESSPRSGTLDRKGRARLDGIDEGDCEVCFPRIDGREWSKVTTQPSAT